MKMQFVILFIACILLISSFQSNFANAQQSTDSNFAGKGKTEYSSHFPGIIVWTMVKGADGTFVYHRVDGQLVVLRTTLTQSDGCKQGLMCYDGTITSAKNSPAIQVGDTFKLTMDEPTNTENITFLSGFLENVDVKISLAKIKTKSISTITETETKEKQNLLNVLRPIIPDTQERAMSFVVHFQGTDIAPPKTVYTISKFVPIVNEKILSPSNSLDTGSKIFYLESLPSKDKNWFYELSSRYINPGSIPEEFDVKVVASP